MLKKFFISMLGTLAGLWLTILIGFIIVVSIVTALMAGDRPSPEVSEGSVLYLDLDGIMPDRCRSAGLMDMLREAETDCEALSDILDAIRLAASDAHIKGMYINAGMWSPGVAGMEEVAGAVSDFRKSGKWVYAYGDNYLQSAYTVATAADSVFLNPVGSVSVHGVGSRNLYFTGLLDKLGVKMQIVRVGTYKSAVEPFFATEMSPASREQTAQMVDTVWAAISGTIAANRSVERGAVTGWADSVMSCWNAPRCLASGAVTSLRYRRQVEDILRDRLGLDGDDDLPLVTPTEYMASHKAFSADKKHVAVLFAEGDIVESGQGCIASDDMVPEILALADDDNVAGLVFRINSGGGSAYASEQIWDALEYFKSTGKPYYVSMGDLAASGGYYIACGADTIYADRTTLTGSIGVFGMVPDFSGLMTGHLGITTSVVESNPNASALSDVYGPMAPAVRDALQGSVDNIYDVFTRRVADGRGMSQDSVKAIAEGRVWVGSRAKQLGLVDIIGGFDDAVAAMTARTGLGRDAVVYYPAQEDDFMTMVLREMHGNINLGGVTLTPEAVRAAIILSRLRTASRIQARAVPVIFY